MVQQVEDLKADLEAHPFRDLGGLVEVKIPLPESGSAESVATAGPDGIGVRNGKYRLPICNGGDIGITELVNRFYSRTVWPLVNQVLARFVSGGTQQRGPGTPRQSGHHRPGLPTLSEASCGAPAREVVDHAGIEVQPDIRVARALVTAGIVRILLDRNCRPTTAIHGISVNAVRPGEVDHSVEPMPIALAVSHLHGVVAGVPIVCQLHDVIEVGHAIQLIHRIKRARTIPGGQLDTIDGVPTANGTIIQAAL